MLQDILRHFSTTGMPSVASLPASPSTCTTQPEWCNFRAVASSVMALLLQCGLLDTKLGTLKDHDISAFNKAVLADNFTTSSVSNDVPTNASCKNSLPACPPFIPPVPNNTPVVAPHLGSTSTSRARSSVGYPDHPPPSLPPLHKLQEESLKPSLSVLSNYWVFRSPCGYCTAQWRWGWWPPSSYPCSSSATWQTR